MPIDLDELERLAAQATPGPWKVTGKLLPEYITDANPNRKIARILRTPRTHKENAHYIVAACNSLPTLIAENRALRERVRELEAQRIILAGKIGTLTRWYDAMAGCEVCEFTQDCDNSEACCTNAIIQWAEEAAKEAGE